MKYLFLFTCTLLFAACGNDDQTTEQSTASKADSVAHADSLQKESDEMSEEVIENSFDALNR